MMLLGPSFASFSNRVFNNIDDDNTAEEGSKPTYEDIKKRQMRRQQQIERSTGSSHRGSYQSESRYSGGAGATSHASYAHSKITRKYILNI